MDRLPHLNSRRSVPSRLLAAPGPDAEQLLAMLTAAVRVPDHGKLVPFRFLTIQGPAREALGELLVARGLERDPLSPPAAVEKDRLRFSFAPLIITVIGHLTSGHKVPEQEQLLTGGAVCFALLQAAQGLGFGAQWLTGWAAYDPVITARLGVSANETVLGFLHVGTAAETAPERQRPDPRSLLSQWTP